MDSKYGVNTFINEVHIKAVDFDETFKLPEYRYIVEIETVYSDNGNGLKEMKIYTEGKLEEFQVGNWKISPIVKMPFNWSGNSDKLELIDKNSNIIIKQGIPDDRSAFKKTDYTLDIKWVFETIREFETIESCKQHQFIEENTETKRLLNILLDVYGDDGTDINNILERCQRISREMEVLSELKNELTEKGYQLSRIQLNETIDLFNKIKMRKISE